MKVISTNEKRNMQMVVDKGQTRHKPIDASKPSWPKTCGKGRKVKVEDQR